MNPLPRPENGFRSRCNTIASRKKGAVELRSKPMKQRQTVLEAAELEFRYPGPSQWQLNIPRIEVCAGEHTYIFGPSGCGKSTLLQLIGGVLSPHRGTIQVMGESLSDGARRDRRRAETMGFVFQSLNLVPYLTTLDNVTLPCRFAPRRRARAASNCSLMSEAKRLLEHLGIGADLWHRKPTELSVGQQQRVAVARALIGRPPLIICDEPTSALDPAARDRFVDLLLSECEAAQATAVVVSHDPSIRSAFRLGFDLSPTQNQTTLRRAA